MKHQKHAIYAAALWGLVQGAESEKEEADIARAFAAYLHTRRLEGLVPKIQKELTNIEQKKKGIVAADVVSATALADAEKEEVVRAIAALVKKDSANVDARFAVDDSLIGGLAVRTPEMIIDGTVRTKLEKLKKQLTA
ncbi:ATP synthase F1 subunit delta [Candidatus Azambacteria bacterium]|nr:ATP synthase F1 subunit delta [Candidatus Azambacteria bacterium]